MKKAPTAVLCHNDLCALGAMLGLSDRGLAPGRDVAVVGFDNIPEGAMHRPALTTVAIGARAIGEEAARLLLRRINSPDGSPESIILPPKLVIRSSCGGAAPQ
jgi:LacI family transcriptional regulator